LKITKEKIIVVGKFRGFGGVQTIHKNLFNIYKSLGYEVFLIDSINEYLSYLLTNKSNSITKIVFFSGLSLIFSPLFIGRGKHVFFTHGFCISPTPTSSMVNAISFSKKVETVPWGVSEEYLKFPIKSNDYKYHLVFLGRPNSQKLQLSTIREVINLFNSQKIVPKTENLVFAFIVPNLNNHLKYIQKSIKEDYGCSIKTFISLDDYSVAEVLSKSLYSFNCFEWEAFGLSYVESLCMGCNVLLPNTSPIIPVIDFMKDSPVFKLNHPRTINHPLIKYELKLTKERMSLNNINLFRSIFKWENTIKQINNRINKKHIDD
jgi:glycosyltransferase involved in cell wall biosynthesis